MVRVEAKFQMTCLRQPAIAASRHKRRDPLTPYRQVSIALQKLSFEVQALVVSDDPFAVTNTSSSDCALKTDYGRMGPFEYDAWTCHSGVSQSKAINTRYFTVNIRSTHHHLQ